MEDILYAQALLVEDGVIRAVGSEAEVRAAAGRDCEMVDFRLCQRTFAGAPGRGRQL